MNAYIATVDLPEEDLHRALNRAVDIALELGHKVILIGRMLDGQLALCTCGCAIDTPGCAVIIPDVQVLEGLANGVALESTKLVRPGGRSALIFKTVPR